MHLRQPPSPGVRPWERNMRMMLHLKGKILISCLTSKSNCHLRHVDLYITISHVIAQGVC